MTYVVEALAPEPFQSLFTMDEEALAGRRALRMVAGEGTYPCRVSLELARPGETILLLNYVSQPADSPFYASHGIYVREGVEQAAPSIDRLPPLLNARTVSLRAFDTAGMLRTACLAEAGEGDEAVRALLEDEHVETVHAHSASYGCYLAAIGREA